MGPNLGAYKYVRCDKLWKGGGVFNIKACDPLAYSLLRFDEPTLVLNVLV